MSIDSEKGTLKLQSVNRSVLPDQVINQLISLLTSNQLKPGDRLPTEMELVKELNVSRTVLREALASLEILGIITRKGRKGTFFNNKIESHPFSIMLSLSENDLESLIEARISLELGLVVIAANKIDEDQLKKLKKTIDAISVSTDDDYGVYDKEFHTIIAESAKNPIVEGVIIALLLAHDKTDKQFIVRDKELTVRQHKKIYTALLNKNPYEAFISMYEHLTDVRDRILNKKTS